MVDHGAEQNKRIYLQLVYNSHGSSMQVAARTLRIDLLYNFILNMLLSPFFHRSLIKTNFYGYFNFIKPYIFPVGLSMFICLIQGVKNICLMYNYRVYNNLFWIFHIQMEYPSAKHVYSYGRANRVSYISLLFFTPWSDHYWGTLASFFDWNTVKPWECN